MRTRTVVLDRMLTLLVGLVLTAAAVAAWLWFYAVPPFTADAIDVGPVRRASGAGWWPWAAGGVGVVLIVLGLRRLAAHLPRRAVKLLRLTSSDDQGHLTLESSALASAAAAEVKDVDGVRSARGRILRERGQLVADLVVVTEPGASLAHVASACDETAAALARMTQRRDLTFRVDLRVARGGRAARRTL